LALLYEEESSNFVWLIWRDDIFDLLSRNLDEYNFIASVGYQKMKWLRLILVPDNCREN